MRFFQILSGSGFTAFSNILPETNIKIFTTQIQGVSRKLDLGTSMFSENTHAKKTENNFM